MYVIQTLVFPCLKMPKSGWKESSVGKSICCSCRESELSSQHSDVLAHDCLKLQCQGYDCSLTYTGSWTHMYIPTEKRTLKKWIFKILRWILCPLLVQWKNSENSTALNDSEPHPLCWILSRKLSLFFSQYIMEINWQPFINNNTDNIKMMVALKIVMVLVMLVVVLIIVMEIVVILLDSREELGKKGCWRAWW